MNVSLVTNSHETGMSRVSGENGSLCDVRFFASCRALCMLRGWPCAWCLREVSRCWEPTLPALLPRLSLPLLGMLSSSLDHPETRKHTHITEVSHSHCRCWECSRRHWTTLKHANTHTSQRWTTLKHTHTHTSQRWTTLKHANTHTSQRWTTLKHANTHTSQRWTTLKHANTHTHHRGGPPWNTQIHTHITEVDHPETRKHTHTSQRWTTLKHTNTHTSQRWTTLKHANTHTHHRGVPLSLPLLGMLSSSLDHPETRKHTHTSQRWQLVRFTHKPYSFLRFARAYDAILTDIYDFCRFKLTIIPRFIFELLSVCNDTSYASWTRK